MNETRILIADRQVSQRRGKVAGAAWQRTALSFDGTHRKFLDVARCNAHVKELTLECLPGVVERIDAVVTSHERGFPCEI
jgi:hypothetical protein